MIVCVCHRVSDRDITQQVKEGCVSFDELQAVLQVGTRCGACRSHAEAAFEVARCCGAGAPQGREGLLTAAA